MYSFLCLTSSINNKTLKQYSHIENSIIAILKKTRGIKTEKQAMKANLTLSSMTSWKYMHINITGSIPVNLKIELFTPKEPNNSIGKVLNSGCGAKVSFKFRNNLKIITNNEIESKVNKKAFL